MNQDSIQSMLKNPEFQKLAKHKAIITWGLSGLVLIAYFGFILTLGFAPEFLAQPYLPGETMTWGIPTGMVIIAFSIVLTGAYTWYANTVLDRETKNARKAFGKEQHNS